MASKPAEKPAKKTASAPKKPLIEGKNPKQAVRPAAAPSPRKSALKRVSAPAKAAAFKRAAARKVKTPAASKSRARRPGPLEQAVRADVRALERVSPVHDSLVKLALSLAKQLDAGAGMAAAAIGRELRATLDDLTRDGGDRDEEFERRLAALSVGDAAQPRPADSRREDS